MEQAGGQEMETQGDGSCRRLRRPRDAVAAAVAAREALAQHPWPDGIDVRVRMGIHTGEAALDADGYLGLAVHRAARICAAGHGGQILLSQTAHTLLEDAEHEFPEVTVRDLGPQRLKDFDRPVRIYWLVAANGARSFPPLKTLDSGEEKDPPFAGRESGLAEAARRAAERAGVLIVDDQALVRAGFKMILEAEADLEVIGEATGKRRSTRRAACGPTSS